MTTGPKTLIAASDVNGTDVYGADGEKLGTIKRIMIDKVSGKVAYAVMNFGGVLGMGGDDRPVPWGVLSYDTGKNGYQTTITEEQLKSAPEPQEGWEQDRDWETRTHTSYNTTPYWI